MFFVTLIVTLSGNDFIKESGFYFIIIHILTGFALIGRSFTRLLSPISLIYFYTTISLAGGSWGFGKEYIIIDSLEAGFNSWEFTNISLGILLLSLTIFLIIGERFIPRNISSNVQLKEVPLSRLLLAIFIFVPFFFFQLNLDVFGGGGDLSTIPKTLFALFIILYLQKYPNWARYVGYVVIILFLATISIHEKREAFFLLIPILFFESLKHSLKLNLKSSIALFFLMIYSLFLILAMSIARGYGGYGEFDSIYDTIALIPAYMSSDIFIGGLLLNLEVGYFYFHGVNAIELVLKDSTILSMGSTLIKPLFLFMPRFMFPFKPEQMIALYTVQHDPAFRAMGGSYPISIFSEFFWNFHLAGLFLIIFLIIFCYYFYMRLIESIENFSISYILFYLVCYFNIIMLARGSGLDMYFLFIILSAFFIMIYSFMDSFLIDKSSKPIK
tara:strand:+ start:965 stop:2293 length:1329 start_codon:yes stop_codon:yes gene_type:complete